MRSIVLASALLVAGCGGGDPAPVDPLALAPTGDTAQNGPVDGISCETSEQVLFHIHAHLAVYVDGAERHVPPGVGIGPPLQFQGGFVVGGSCFSWLHTHDDTGIIHIESPTQRTYTLGNFFDIWGQPLSTTQAGPASGAVTAFVNGQPWTGSPTDIPLDPHAVIQLDVGTPVVAAMPYTFAPGL